jgi:hypothetical protein
MRTIITLIASLALMAPAASQAAVHAAPGAHRAPATNKLTARGPSSTVPTGFGGPQTTFDATLTPPRTHGCGPERTFNTTEDDSELAPDVRMHFALRAPHKGWCSGRYRVVVREHTSVPASPDACASSADNPCASNHGTETSVLLRTSFRVP